MQNGKIYAQADVIALMVSLVQLFVKVHNEKAECLVKAVKKCFLKKLSV